MGKKRVRELAGRLLKTGRPATGITIRSRAHSLLHLVREMKSAYNHRLRLVAHARQQGTKPTAALFQTTVPTVRKWLRRFQQQGRAASSNFPALLITSPARLSRRHRTAGRRLAPAVVHFGTGN